MRTEEEFEKERYYGIQKFYKPQDAFCTMSDFWGQGMCCGTDNLVVGEHNFLERILERITVKLFVREEIKRHKKTLGKIDRDYFWDNYLDGIFQCYVSDMLGEI